MILNTLQIRFLEANASGCAGGYPPPHAKAFEWAKSLAAATTYHGRLASTHGLEPAT